MRDGLVTSEQCLACEVCCRFHEAGSLMAPVFSAAEMAAADRAGLTDEAFCRAGYGRSEPVILQRGRGHWTCPAFDETANRCCIYAARPLDCRLYPFVLTFDEAGQSVHLAADLACPQVVDNLCTSRLVERAQHLARSIDGSLWQGLGRDAAFVAFRRPEFEVLALLPEVTRSVCRPDLGLARLTPQAIAELQLFFSADGREPAHHALAPIFVWTDLFNLYYRVAGDRLLLFGEEGGAAFLWLPPVGSGPMAPAVEEAVEILRRLGREPETWRIDNVAEDQLPILTGLGLRAAERTEEFIYDRARLAAPTGRRYHGMKASCNVFVKQNEPVAFEPFSDADIPEALALQRRWASARLATYTDAFYRAQIEAAMLMHYRTMRHAGAFGLVGRSLRAGERLVGYTFGFSLPGTETAVILIEVADLAVKGAAAYLFREFARSWAPLKRINAMGDSGLPNLRRAKMAQHPQALLPVHTVRPPA